MRFVEQIRLNAGMTVNQLIGEMGRCGALGAGKLAEATDLITEMFRRKEYTVCLSISGPLVAGGLRVAISSLIEEGYVHVLVTTGANIVHDIVEALGYRHIRGTFLSDDAKLRARGIGRIGDIYIQQKAFEKLEKWLHRMMDELAADGKEKMSVRELLAEFGRRLRDPNSILVRAAERNVPIICPGFLDSILGFQLWGWSQTKKFRLDLISDLDALVKRVLEARKVGAIILGGGVPKHFLLFSNSYRGGVDLAVQVTMDRPEPGGLSGASLDEAVSWSKVKAGRNARTVICDVTIAFPIMVAAALERVKGKS